MNAQAYAFMESALLCRQMFGTAWRDTPSAITKSVGLHESVRGIWCWRACGRRICCLIIFLRPPDLLDQISWGSVVGERERREDMRTGARGLGMVERSRCGSIWIRFVA